MVNIPFQWWLLQISIFPALSSSAVIYSPFWQISCAPVKRPLHHRCGPCSSGSSKQHESVGTPQLLPTFPASKYQSMCYSQARECCNNWIDWVTFSEKLRGRFQRSFESPDFFTLKPKSHVSLPLCKLRSYTRAKLWGKKISILQHSAGHSGQILLRAQHVTGDGAVLHS